MSKSRLLPAALIVVLPLVGCAAGQKDATSSEHATPYLADAHVGPLQIRNVVIYVASTTTPSANATPSAISSGLVGPTASPAGTPSPSSSTGGPQAYLAMVVLGNTTDELTGAALAAGGTITPTDATTALTVAPHSILTISDPESGTTNPGLAIAGVTPTPRIGTTMRVTLTFRTAGQVTVDAPVRELPGA